MLKSESHLSFVRSLYSFRRVVSSEVGAELTLPVSAVREPWTGWIFNLFVVSRFGVSLGDVSRFGVSLGGVSEAWLLW